MKRSFTTAFMFALYSGCLASSLIELSADAVAQPQLTIELDGELQVVLKAAAKDVIVGNPAIADVTMVSPTNLVVIGHTPGRTRLLVLDADQTPLLDQIVIVTEGDTGLVSVFGPRGGAITQDDYACGYHCTLMPGARAASGGGGGSGGGQAESYSVSIQKQPAGSPPVPTNNPPPQQSPDNTQPSTQQGTKQPY